MKRTKFYFLGLAVLAVIGIMATSCGNEETTPAPTVEIHYTVDGYTVAFTALATNADSFVWDFGDGETSTEASPTHIYEVSGTYTVKVTAKGPGGSTDATTDVEIAASKLEMLTGGPLAKDGKAWSISQQASEGDAVVKADQDFTVEQPIPSGMIGLIGMPDEYTDQFIFHNDGKYTHSTGNNDSVIVTQVYAVLMQIPYRPSDEDAVGVTPFTPGKNASFTLEEDADLTLPVTSDEYKDSTWTVTWSGVDVLEIKNSDTSENEFFGLLDFTRKYVVFNISTDAMQVGTFISATDGKKANYPSHMIRITYVPAAE